MSALSAVPAAVRPKAVAVTAALVVLVGSFVVLRGGGETTSATLFLPRAVHLYEGSDVVVLGVRIGEVVSVSPQGDRVRVELRWDSEHRVPADAQAALVSPTLIADRYVQLTPVYDGGPVMADGAEIPLSRATVPVELDEIVATLTDLATALGPDGANSKGALADLVAVGADNLEGNGAAAGQALRDVSKLSQTLAGNREEIFGTVRSLQALTTELAENDATVRAFTSDLAEVSGQLAGERERLAEALRQLALALEPVAGFVRDNRGDLAANVRTLGVVADALADEREDIGHVLDIAPVGIANFAQFYDPVVEALAGRINGNDKYESPAYFLCSLIVGVGGSPEDCQETLGPLADISLRQPQEGGSSADSASAPSSAPPPSRAPAPPVDRSLAGLLTGGLR